MSLNGVFIEILQRWGKKNKHELKLNNISSYASFSAKIHTDANALGFRTTVLTQIKIKKINSAAKYIKNARNAFVTLFNRVLINMTVSI